MKNKIIFVLALCIFLIFGCAKVTQEQAVSQAQNFVDTYVKLQVKDNTKNQTNITEATISVLEASLDKGEWNVKLLIESTQTGELKRSGLNVVVDSKTGEVKRDKVFPFRLGDR